MQILCARIDDLNDQMGFVLNTMPDTQKRLAGAEHHLKTLVYNLQGFESKDEFDTCAPGSELIIPNFRRSLDVETTYSTNSPSANVPVSTLKGGAAGASPSTLARPGSPTVAPATGIASGSSPVGNVAAGLDGSSAATRSSSSSQAGNQSALAANQSGKAEIKNNSAKSGEASDKNPVEATVTDEKTEVVSPSRRKLSLTNKLKAAAKIANKVTMVQRKLLLSGFVETDRSAAADATVHDASGKNLAQKRWRWAYSQVKMTMMLKKGAGMTNMRLAPNLSVSARLDRLEYRLDQFPEPGDLFEMIRVMPEMKRRVNTVEEQVAKMWAELEMLQMLRQQVEEQGQELARCKETIVKHTEKLVTLVTKQETLEAEQQRQASRQAQLQDEMRDLKEDFSLKLVELKEDLETQIEEQLNLLKAAEKEQAKAFRQTTSDLRTLRENLDSNLDPQMAARGLGPKQITADRFECIREAVDGVLQEAESMGDGGDGTGSGADDEAPPPLELISKMQELAGTIHRCLSEDDTHVEELERAQSEEDDQLAQKVEASQWSILRSCMTEPGSQVTMRTRLVDTVGALIEATQPHIRVLRVQLGLEETQLQLQRSTDEAFDTQNKLLNTKADHKWTEAELEKKSDKTPVEHLRDNLQALGKDLTKKNKDLGQKLGKSINETIARFNRLQEQMGTKAATNRLNREIEQLNERIAIMRADMGTEHRNFVAGMIKDKVTRRELEQALKALSKLGEDSSDQDMEIVASIMPYRCLACNSPLKKVNEVKKYSPQQSFFPPSTTHAPNSLQILRPQTSPSIPSKTAHQQMHNKKTLLDSTSATHLPPATHHHISLNPGSSMRRPHRLPAAQMSESKVFASYPGFLPTDRMNNKGKTGGGYAIKR